MANHPSAKKRHRQNLERRARNAGIRSRMRTAIKGARTAPEAGLGGDALKSAVQTIYKTASKGVISKQTASRRVSRLMKAAAKAAAPAQA